MSVNPKLTNQYAEYAEKQLKGLKAKTDRNHPIVSLCASTLSDQGMENIGVYLGRRPAWKSDSAKSKDTIELGQRLCRGGDTGRGIATCVGHHGPTGVGTPAQYPYIAG